MDKITIKTISIEVFSVVFAVLLALGLNNFWKERSNRQLGLDALKNIIHEIEININELDTSLIELKVELDTLVADRNRLKNDESADVTLGYTQPILTDNAWNTANITQAVLYIEPEIIMDISDLYTMQELFADFGLSYFKQFSTLEFNRKENELTVLNSNIRQIQMSISLGEQLLEGYKNFFTDHKELLDKLNVSVPELEME